MKNIIPEQKICPFCGQESILCYNPKIKKYKVYCDNINCDIQPETIWFDNPLDPVEVWNKRYKENE